SWQQTYEMIQLSQQYAQESHDDIGLFFAVDEEGGSVARVSNKLNTYSCYDMEYYGNKLDYDAVYNVGSTIGTALSELGFNINLAPVADVNISPSNELGSRIFSSDAQVVSDMTANFVKGVEDIGVSATLKHFPGLGAGTGNTHNGSVIIDRSYSDLANTEFQAFKGGIEAGADFVMVGHQITTASQDNMPGDLSPVVISWLKDDLGFNGLIITDSQSMGAITENYTSGEAAVLSIKAGVDIILMPYDLHNAVSGIRDSVNSGDISEERINESVRKILTKKLNLGLIDIDLPEETTSVNQ
ncbi:MAG: glycoside hydrolase family 3 protein, partial [Ruminococcus sp.]